MNTTDNIYRMSECGHCPKRLSYARLGYEPLPRPEWLDQAAEEGNWHEQRMKDELRADDIAVYGEQDELVIKQDGITLVGHRDGLCNDHGDEMLLECKSMSQQEFGRWMRGRWQEFPWYANQVVCYAIASGLDKVRYLVKNRNNGYLEDKTATLDELGGTSRLGIITRRLADVNNHVDLNTLVDCEYNPEKIECRRFCEFRHHCMPPPPVLAEDQEAELTQATTDWRRGKALIEEGEALVEPAKAILRLYTELTPDHKMIFDNVLSTVYPVHKVSYPKKEVEARLPTDILAEIAKVEDRWDCRITDLREKE